MSDLFFFGTLRHIPLLELVLGRPASEIDLVPAELADHGAFAVKGEAFPTIEARPGHVAKGLLARNLSAADVAALNYYEGGFSYDLKEMSVTPEGGGTAAAEVYFPQPGLWEAGEPWDLDRWVAEWGAMSLRAAGEVMAYHGRVPAAKVAERMYSIRVRAAAWVAAQAEPEIRDLSRDVHVLKHERSHLSFFGQEEMDLQYRRHDGRMSPVLNRSAQMVGRASVVLPYDAQRDQVLLVEQFRAPVFFAGDRNPWVWEPVAGLVDPGETPEQAAYREALEEAGVTLSALEPVAQCYSSTGASGEYLHIFLGVTDLSQVEPASGVAEEGEDIRSEIISYDALMQGIDDQTWRDMPLVTAALWLARHRDRLRREAGISA